MPNQSLFDFELKHTSFIENHLKNRSGERRGRLERGHQYAEKLFLQHVWFPLFANFDQLHPEYEIYDWNRRSQFLDFAWIPKNGVKIGIECDGFQSHVKDMDREKFSYALNRDNFLTGMGWKMLHFAFDDIQRRPEVCRMLLQMNITPTMMGKPNLIQTKTTGRDSLTPMQKEILKLAWRLGRPIAPADIIKAYTLNFRTVRRHLQALVESNLIQPIGNGNYIRYYEVIGEFPLHILD